MVALEDNGPDEGGESEDVEVQAGDHDEAAPPTVQAQELQGDKREQGAVKGTPGQRYPVCQGPFGQEVHVQLGICGYVGSPASDA